ncbi:uncharacterized protein LOC133949799 isoform X2 [Platichthys flesus]|nr:uncharacterized protein LOC133949799 isoform X2 [Platichthys flesus]
MRERNDPTIKETVIRALRTSPLYRKRQSSNGCQKFSSERQKQTIQITCRTPLMEASAASSDWRDSKMPTSMPIYLESTEVLTETGREGLLCVLRVQAQQAAAGLTYSGTAEQSLDDSSEDENMASSSQEKRYGCASAPRSLLQPPLLMLTSCLHHTKQQTWIDRPFSRAAPSL